MFPVGGVSVMLLGAVLALVPCAAFAAWQVRRGGNRASAYAFAGFVWTVLVIGLVTLIPAHGAPGYVPADTRSSSCSWDYGGPAPDGFWIFAGGQRPLNTALFVPSGALLVVFLARWGWRSVLWLPVGLGALALYSAAIERTQLGLARLDRACDVTDFVDNVTGAALGMLVGIPLALLLRPWRR